MTPRCENLSYSWKADGRDSFARWADTSEFSTIRPTDLIDLQPCFRCQCHSLLRTIPIA